MSAMFSLTTRDGAWKFIAVKPPPPRYADRRHRAAVQDQAIKSRTTTNPPLLTPLYLNLLIICEQ